MNRIPVFFAGSDLGLLRYAEPLWSTPDALRNIDSEVNGISEDNDGAIWISNRNRLISYRSNETAVYETDLPFSYVKKSGNVHAFSNHQIAVEFFSVPESCIYIFDVNEKTFSPLLHPSGQFLRGFFVNNETIWIISGEDYFRQTIVYQYDGEMFTTILDMNSVLQSLERLILESIVKTKNGNFWIGLPHPFGPLLYKKNGDYVLFDDLQTFPGTGCSRILNAGDRRIWCTGKNEVIEYDGSVWRIVKKGVDFAQDIIKDRHGRIWIAANNGVHCYNPSQSHSWVHYTVQDGLPVNTVRTLFEDSQGSIWAGTHKGVSKFNPDSDASPPIVWMAPDKNSETITSDGSAQFVFDGIDKWKQTQKERLLYSYRIDDEEWSEFTIDTVAAFKAIAPGEHIFHVRAMDLNWNVSENPAIHQFRVLQPWHRDPKVISIISVSSILVLLFAGIAVNRHHKLNKYSHRLEISNTQLNAMNSELQEANAQLIQLDQMKSQFVSQASHDLRTPLTAIKGSLDNLLMGIAGDLNEKQSKIMERATKSVDRLTNLINDVLDLNRIETGRIVLEKTDIPFKTLVENIIHENRPAAEQKQIKLSFDAEEGDYTLHVDGGKMERVVGELISNAIKYTPGSGSVDVHLTHRDNSVSLSVQDSGIGMTQEECEKIWERFYRTSASKKFAKGSGLGLSIVKELVELHEGSLDVLSESGKGTLFVLRLPASFATGASSPG